MDDRIAIREVFADVGSKYVPPHVNIFYCFGGLVFTSFVCQVTTGAAMTFYYVPEVSRSLASVAYITYSARNGWALRSMHRWTASFMVLSLVCHVYRVYLTGGFKKPRELTWLTGIGLSICTVSFGVTGYSLPFDQVGYWAIRIVTGVPDSFPLLGPVIVGVLRGGPSVGQGTLNRFFAAHVLVLPLLTAILMLSHFLFIRKQGISGPL